MMSYAEGRKGAAGGGGGRRDTGDKALKKVGGGQVLAVLGHPRGALQQRCGLLLRYEAVEKGESAKRGRGKEGGGGHR